MPNWVKTQIAARGDKEQVQKLVETVKRTYTDENGEEHKTDFSFESIIHMPESLSITDGSGGELGMRYLLALAKNEFSRTKSDNDDIVKMNVMREKDPDRYNECVDLGRQYLKNIADHGCKTWYDWCREHWGTKWDACEVEGDGLGNYTFETAWCFCYPVIEKLSEMFPELEIWFAYADEDCGSNTGTGTFKGGELVESEFPDTCSDRAYELYCQCWGEEDNFVKCEDGEWRWLDEIEDSDEG